MKLRNANLMIATFEAFFGCEATRPSGIFEHFFVADKSGSDFNALKQHVD
jgi:hypothetical protein